MIKKQYTSLAVSIDTRSEEEIEADKELARKRKARFAKVLGMIWRSTPL